MSFLSYFPRAFSSSRPWGLCLLGRKSQGGRKLSSSERNPVGGGLQPRAPGSGQAGSRRALSWAVGLTGQWLRHQGRPWVSPCQAERKLYPPEGSRPELRAPPPLQEGDTVKGEAQGCPGLRTELCPEPRGLALRPAPAQSKRLPVASGRGGGRVRGSEHRLGPQTDPVSVPEGL